MSEENKNQSHRGFVMVITIAIAVPLLYVLSVGPATAICDRYPKFFPAYKEFYLPLAWLADHTPLGKPLYWYCELW